MNEVQIGPNSYQIGRLDAMRQLHVSRRILPVLVAAGISITDIMAAGASIDGDAWLIRVADKALDVVAKMTDADVEYVVHACLSVTKRRLAATDAPWVQVMTGKQFQFQDIDLPTMVQVTIAVLRENMGGFFPQGPEVKSTPIAS